jgi:hypothetical protein
MLNAHTFIFFRQNNPALTLDVAFPTHNKTRLVWGEFTTGKDNVAVGYDAGLNYNWQQ